MALTCVLLPASQMMKKSATASGILRRSSEMIFSPFFSWIAFIMDLNNLEFLVNLPAPERLRRVVKIDNCSNNQNIFCE